MTDEIRQSSVNSRRAARRAGPSAGVPARLAPLDDLPNFKVAEGDPDVRGLDVESADGKKIGEVHDLIVDIAAMKVRYLDVDVDNALLDTEEDRHILVPVGCATLNADADVIDLTNVSSADLPSIPGYRHGPITRDFESSVRECYTAAAASRTGGAGAARTGPAPGETTPASRRVGGARSANVDDDAAFYGHEHFDDRRFFGNLRRGRHDAHYITRAEEEPAVEKRTMPMGESEQRRVEDERVTRQVPVTREEVAAARRPVQPGVSARSELVEKEIQIPVTEDEAIIRQRADAERKGRPEEK